MKRETKNGFTLIELLTVLAIISLLTYAGFTVFSVSATKSRDSRRERDMKNLENALSLYANDFGVFPICPQEAPIDGVSDCLSAALSNSGAAKSSPRDPRHGVGGGSCRDNGSFYYCYLSADGKSYTIRYALESNSILGKSAGWQTINP